MGDILASFSRRCRSGQRILPDFLPGRYFETQNGPHIEKSKLLIVTDSLIKVIA